MESKDLVAPGERAIETAPEGRGQQARSYRSDLTPVNQTDQGSSDDELDLAGLYQLVRRRWQWAAAIFLVVIVATGMLYRSAIPVYVASTTLRFDKSPTTIPGLDFAFGEKNDLATESLALRSFTLASDVVELARLDVVVAEPVNVSRDLLVSGLSVAPDARRGTYLFTRRDSVFDVQSPDSQTVSVPVGVAASHAGLGFQIVASATQFERFALDVVPLTAATKALRNAISVSKPSRDASVLEVEYKSTDAELTRQVPDVLTQRFIARQMERRQTGTASTVRFISEQLQELDAQLAGAEARLRDWRQRLQVVQPEAEAGNAVKRRADFEAQIARAREEIVAIEGLLAQDGGQAGGKGMPGYRRVLGSPLILQGQVGSTILSAIFSLESKRAELLGTLTPKDPQVQLVEQMLVDYESQGEEFVRNYITIRRAEIATYERQLNDVGGVITSLPTRDLELKVLARDVEILSSLQMVLRQRLKESEIANAADMPSVEVLDPARLPEGPESPQLFLYLTVGLSLALGLAVAAAFLRDHLDRTIHTSEALERAVKVTMVGLIPSLSTRKPVGWRQRKALARPRTDLQRASIGGKELITAREPRHVSSEAYRTLRANLLLGSKRERIRVLALTSPSPGDGKSTTTANLAVVMAMQGDRVLVLDTDLRLGTLHEKFGGHRETGLSDLLAQDEPVEQAIPARIQKLTLPNGVEVHFIAAGRAPENPTELLGGQRWADVVAWARKHYTMVLFDTPPVNMFADALVSCADVDALLLVVRASKTGDQEAAIAASQIRAVGIPLRGAILNDFQVDRDGRYGNYGYYHYYHSRYHEHYEKPSETKTGA